MSLCIPLLGVLIIVIGTIFIPSRVSAHDDNPIIVNGSTSSTTNNGNDSDGNGEVVIEYAVMINGTSSGQCGRLPLSSSGHVACNDIWLAIENIVRLQPPPRVPTNISFLIHVEPGVYRRTLVTHEIDFQRATYNITIITSTSWMIGNDSHWNTKLNHNNENNNKNDNDDRAVVDMIMVSSGPWSTATWWEMAGTFHLNLINLVFIPRTRGMITIDDAGYGGQVTPSSLQMYNVTFINVRTRESLVTAIEIKSADFVSLNHVIFQDMYPLYNGWATRDTTTILITMYPSWQHVVNEPLPFIHGTVELNDVIFRDIHGECGDAVALRIKGAQYIHFNDVHVHNTSSIHWLEQPEDVLVSGAIKISDMTTNDQHTSADPSSIILIENCSFINNTLTRVSDGGSTGGAALVLQVVNVSSIIIRHTRFGQAFVNADIRSSAKVYASALLIVPTSIELDIAPPSHSILLDHVTFLSNRVRSWMEKTMGGAWVIASGESVTIIDSIFEDNQITSLNQGAYAHGAGGAILCQPLWQNSYWSCHLNITRSQWLNNGILAEGNQERVMGDIGGAGLMITSDIRHREIIIDQSTFDSNWITSTAAPAYFVGGSAIMYCYDHNGQALIEPAHHTNRQPNVRLSNSAFSNNFMATNQLQPLSYATVALISFPLSECDNYDSATVATPCLSPVRALGTLELINLTVINNTVDGAIVKGGGIAAHVDTVTTITNVVVMDNRVTVRALPLIGMGGGIYLECNIDGSDNGHNITGCDVSISNSVFESNSVHGAIFGKDNVSPAHLVGGELAGGKLLPTIA
jgi:hypothetical protein